MEETAELLSLDDVDFNGSLEKIAEKLPLTLFVLGPPGSGKSTTTKLFYRLLSSAKHFGENAPDVLLINTGELLRYFANSNENAEVLRNPVRDKMRDGNLVSQASKIFVWYRVMNQFLKTSPDGTLIFDGSPRNTDERRILLELLFEMDRKPFLVEISASEEELCRRLSLRDEGRTDDENLEAVKKRLLTYRDVTKAEITKIKTIIPVETLEAKLMEGELQVLRRFVQRVRSGLHKIK